MKLIALKVTRDSPSGKRVEVGQVFEPKTDRWGVLQQKLGIAKLAPEVEAELAPDAQKTVTAPVVASPPAKTVTKRVTKRVTKTAQKTVTGTRNRSMAGNTDTKAD